jgi:hypothetical protein
MSSLLYINLVPSLEQDAFAQKVTDVATALQCDPNWLMQVMKAESGLRSDIQNTTYPLHNGYATGLIQFTPDTAASLGTTTDDLKQMSRVDQMDYVQKYFSPYIGQLNSYFAIYLVTFFPAAISHVDDDTYIFQTNNIAASSIAKSNPTIDINGDGQITMAEFKQYVQNSVQQQYWDQIFTSPATVVVEVVKNNLMMVIILAVVSMGIAFAIIQINNKKVINN